jgi:hypothetical protein
VGYNGWCTIRGHWIELKWDIIDGVQRKTLFVEYKWEWDTSDGAQLGLSRWSTSEIQWMVYKSGTIDGVHVGSNGWSTRLIHLMVY